MVQARTTATIMARSCARVAMCGAGDRVPARTGADLLDGRGADARRARPHAWPIRTSPPRPPSNRRPMPPSLWRARRMRVLRACTPSARPRRRSSTTPPARCARRKRVRPAPPPARRPPCQAWKARAPPARRQTRQRSFARITAPFDGVVTEKMVEPGNMAAPGTPLMRLEDTRGFRLDVRVDESRIGQISPGAIVPVSLDSGTGRRRDDGQRHGGGDRPRGRRRRAGVSRQDRAARRRRAALGHVRPGALQRPSHGAR